MFRRSECECSQDISSFGRISKPIMQVCKQCRERGYAFQMISIQVCDRSFPKCKCFVFFCFVVLQGESYHRNCLQCAVERCFVSLRDESDLKIVNGVIYCNKHAVSASSPQPPSRADVPARSRSESAVNKVAWSSTHLASYHVTSFPVFAADCWKCVCGEEGIQLIQVESAIGQSGRQVCHLCE